MKAISIIITENSNLDIFNSYLMDGWTVYDTYIIGDNALLFILKHPTDK